MAGLRDPFRYREEAERFLALADTHAENPQLRDGYLALALQFERVAAVLEKRAAGEAPQPRARVNAIAKPDPKAGGGIL